MELSKITTKEELKEAFYTKVAELIVDNVPTDGPEMKALIAEFVEAVTALNQE